MSFEDYTDRIQLAFNNSYSVLFDKETDVDELILNGNGFFIFHPSELPTDKEIEEMIIYFRDSEEYEKCAQLTKYKNGI